MERFNTQKGQHILTDEDALDIFEQNVNKGGNVIEVGSGSGNVTRRLAKHAGKVVGFEVDHRFGDDLSKLQEEYPNVKISYKDVLGVDLKKILKGKTRDQRWQAYLSTSLNLS